MKIFEERANAEIISHLRGTKNKMDVKAGKCRFNYRCQMNAVNDAITQGHNKVAMCVYIDEGYPIMHFVNVNKKGVFTDNTLGNWAVNYEYFFIKYIDDVDFFTINDVLIDYRVELKKQLGFFNRLLGKSVF